MRLWLALLVLCSVVLLAQVTHCEDAKLSEVAKETDETGLSRTKRTIKIPKFLRSLIPGGRRAAKNKKKRNKKRNKKGLVAKVRAFLKGLGGFRKRVNTVVVRAAKLVKHLNALSKILRPQEDGEDSKENKGGLRERFRKFSESLQKRLKKINDMVKEFGGDIRKRFDRANSEEDEY